jgi:hypothetical protein
MGLDATAPLDETHQGYERAQYEPVDLAQYNIEGEI